MTLKTLKDLGIEELKDRKGFSEQVIRVEELKQEAINWIKSIDNPLTDREVAAKLELYSKCKTQEEVQNCLFGTRRLLIIQNNLTEEDLK